MKVGRRLLEGFEEGIGGLVVGAVHAIDEEDAASALVGQVLSAVLDEAGLLMEIWRSGPSGRSDEIGVGGKQQRVLVALVADHFSRAATMSRFVGQAEVVHFDLLGWPRRRAARRRARVALPTPSGPEKSRVWARRWWAIMRSSARVTCGLPQKLSNIGADDAPDLALDGIHIGAAVDQLDALGLAGARAW